MATKVSYPKYKSKLVCLGLMAWFLLLANFSSAENQESLEKIEGLILSEIMYDPPGNNDGQADWIELHNSGEKTISLKKDSFGLIDEEEIKLGKDQKHYLGCHKISDSVEIAPGDFVILTDEKDDFENSYPEMKDEKLVEIKFDLSSKGDHLRLSNDRCQSFFLEMEYEDSWGGKDNGKTLEKKDWEKDDYREKDWQESFVLGGTPGEKNSEKPKKKEDNFSQKIRINEFLPNPKGKDEEGEYIELFNSENRKINLENWTLKDNSKTKFVFPKDTFIPAQNYLLLKRAEFDFSINNSNESLFLLDPEEKLISTVSFSSSAKENVSWNFDENTKSWRSSRFLTPGKKNRFNKRPQIDLQIDEKIYTRLYAQFEVKAKDPDHDELKFVWDFGDGHKSYQEKVRHKFEKKGKYAGTLKVSDGSEEIVQKFSLEVINYPKIDLEITALSPNPTGRDSENEWIRLSNNSKKKVNLKDWSLATGGKNLYNHPIREDFYLKPKSSRTLARDICAFSLNNKQARVELRYPGGKVADQVEYEKKEKSIKEEELYEKIAGEWVWRETALLEEPEKIVLAAKTEKEEILLADKELNKDLWGKSSQKTATNLKNDLLCFSKNKNCPAIKNQKKLYEKENQYIFTFSQSSPPWTFSAFSQLSAKINALLNQLFFFI